MHVNSNHFRNVTAVAGGYYVIGAARGMALGSYIYTVRSICLDKKQVDLRVSDTIYIVYINQVMYDGDTGRPTCTFVDLAFARYSVKADREWLLSL